MIIHTYLTDGFLEWGKLFLESYKYYNGEDKKIIMDTRDLNKNQIKSLNDLYKNLQIKNKKLNYDEISKRARIPKDILMTHKKKVEMDSVTKESKYWKLYISVEDRYRNTIESVIRENQEEDFVLHMDIDMYVRNKLDYLFDLIKSNDISIRFREKAHKEVQDNRKVLGNIIGFRICDKSLRFIKTWQKYIDKVPLHKKIKGYGQSSFYYAYLEHKNDLVWGSLPEVAKSKAKNSILWTANKGSNTGQLKKCREDFISRKEGK